MMAADIPTMLPADALAVGDRYWWCGRPVEVLEVDRYWLSSKAGLTVVVEPINGEGWPPRRLAYFADELVELCASKGPRR